jgi:uncharacterized protein (TIGR02246 family)
MSLDPRLQGLLDREEIGELLIGFGAALDSKDWRAYAETFVEEGEFTILGQTRRGREEIAAGPARDLEPYGALQHFSTNHRIQVSGDEATASHYLLGVHVPDAADPSQHADIGGRYDCRCTRTAEGWRFTEVELTVLWSAGATFRIEPADAGT